MRRGKRLFEYLGQDEELGLGRVCAGAHANCDRCYRLTVPGSGSGAIEAARAVVSETGDAPEGSHAAFAGLAVGQVLMLRGGGNVRLSIWVKMKTWCPAGFAPGRVEMGACG